MNVQSIIQAWKDEVYRLSLSTEEQAELPSNPAGLVELTDLEMELVSGGGGTTAESGCTASSSCGASYCVTACETCVRSCGISACLCDVYSSVSTCVELDPINRIIINP
jgi:mersacidin/lichenicidin family type 2 lantibiotic